MQRSRLAVVTAALASFFLVASCGGRQKRKVSRVGEDTTTDLSGKWNDTDARLTSDRLIKDCLAAPWLNRFVDSEGRPPSVRVVQIDNKTDEHIDAQVFIKNIERAFVNSGQVDVVAQKSERGAVEYEQNLGAGGSISDETAASIGNETGADFVVVVRLASILDQIEGEKAKFYQINFELVGASSGKKAWLGEHKIKKVIQQERW